MIYSFLNHISNIKFNGIQIFIYKTPLYKAVEKENIKIIKLLLTNKNLDINIPYVYKIQNQTFQYNYKSNFNKITINIFLNNIKNHIL